MAVSGKSALKPKILPSILVFVALVFFTALACVGFYICHDLRMMAETIKNLPDEPDIPGFPEPQITLMALLPPTEEPQINFTVGEPFEFQPQNVRFINSDKILFDPAMNEFDAQDCMEGMGVTVNMTLTSVSDTNTVILFTSVDSGNTEIYMNLDLDYDGN